MHVFFAFLLSFQPAQPAEQKAHPFVPPAQYAEIAAVPSHKEILTGDYAGSAWHSRTMTTATSTTRSN